SSLVVVEHKDGQIAPSTLNALSAAAKLGGTVHALVAGSTSDAVADQVAKLAPISKVLVASDAAYDHGVAENNASLIAAAQKAGNYSHIVAAHSAFGKNVLPRAAALLDVAQVSDVTGVESADTFTRPFYAGNAIATVKSNDAVKLLTVRPTAFPPASTQDAAAAKEAAPDAEKTGTTQWIKEEVVKSDRPDLGNARVVVSGGRALKSGDNFKILYNLADKLGGTVGASRAAVDAGYVDNSLQIGQTGKVVAPELYIAVGISGAIQHVAGMKESKVIVAINKDGEAPIFQLADYGLVGDLFKIVPELTEKIKA
ncbi:electron transfer flavo protein subunit alpha, mitochondrial precursor, partial [Syncephalis pseudoplumigaleata]